MKQLRLLAILIPTLILLWITVISQGVLDCSDGVQHYLIARWAFKHPELFLDHWGKPFFTLLASPFALLFRFKGMMLFNIFLFFITAYFLMKIFKKLFPESKYFSLFIPFVLISAPIYTEMILSGMTEILFATLTVISLYFFIEKKYILATVCASFLPFSRPEYGVIIPLITLTLLYRKQWKALPFIFTAFILYCIWGIFVFDDFLWFIHQHTYTGDASFYGHGEWYHFLKQYPNITGKFLAILIFIATFGNIHYLMKKKKWTTGFAPELFFIVSGGTLGVLFVHSYLWWKGSNGSLGLIRVMATIIPLAVLYAGWGIAQLYSLIREKINMPALLALINVLLIIFTIKAMRESFRSNYFPIRFSTIDQVVMHAASFTKKHFFNNQRVVYQYPLFAYGLGIDIFDKTKAWPLYSVNKRKPSNSMNTGDLLFWDAHFGPNESQIPLNTLFSDEQLDFLQAFFPKERIKVLGNNDFCAFLMEKKKGKYPLKITMHTFVNDTTIEVKGDFPYLLRTPSEKSVKEAFNQILITYSAEKNTRNNPVYFVIAIKNNNNDNIYYASEPVVQGNHQVSFTIPQVRNNQIIEIQLFNPSKEPKGEITFSALMKKYIK